MSKVMNDTEFVMRTLAELGFSKKIMLPLKVISNVQATLEMVLPKEVKGVAVIYNSREEGGDLFKSTIAKIRPNSFVLCMMDPSQSKQFVTLFYK